MTILRLAAIDNAKDFAADCARRAAEFRKKAHLATDRAERDRLAGIAAALEDDAAFWSR